MYASVRSNMIQQTQRSVQEAPNYMRERSVSHLVNPQQYQASTYVFWDVDKGLFVALNAKLQHTDGVGLHELHVHRLSPPQANAIRKIRRKGLRRLAGQ